MEKGTGEPTSSDDEVVSMDLDSDSPSPLNNGSNTAEISRDQTERGMLDKKTTEPDKNETRIEQKSTQAGAANQQGSIPDSNLTLQESSPDKSSSDKSSSNMSSSDKPSSKERHFDSALSHSKVNKVQSVSNNNDKVDTSDLNETQLKFGKDSSKHKEMPSNVGKESRTEDSTVQPNKDTNDVEGNTTREESKGGSSRHRESRIESEDASLGPQAKKQPSTKTKRNSEPTKSLVPPVFDQARNAQTSRSTSIQQTQNKQTPPPKLSQSSVASHQQQIFRSSQSSKSTTQLSPSISHQHPNIKQSTSVQQQCRIPPSPNNNVRQLSTTNQSDYRLPRALAANNNSQHLYHLYRPAQTHPNISQQVQAPPNVTLPTPNVHRSLQLYSNFQHQYIQPHTRYSFPLPSNAQRPSINNLTPFRLQQTNYQQYQASQHLYRSNQQQSRQSLQSYQVSSRSSHSRSSVIPTSDQKSTSPATRYDHGDKNKHNKSYSKPQCKEIRDDQRTSKSNPPKLHNSSSVTPQDPQAEPRTVEASKANNNDTITPNLNKSKSDNLNSPSITQSQTENNSTKIVESEVNDTDRMNVDASTEVERNDINKQPNDSPDRVEVVELIECRSGNSIDDINHKDINLTGQCEGSETRKVDKGKGVLVDIDDSGVENKYDTKSNKDVTKDATDPLDNTETELLQPDEEVELLPGALEKYRAFDEALYEFDQVAQRAYAAYQNLEKFLPPGTFIKITPSSSLKWNMIAKMTGITKKRRYSESFSVNDTMFNEMNENKIRNSSMEEDEIRNHALTKNRSKRFARSDPKGGDRKVDASSSDEMIRLYNGEGEDEDEDESTDDEPRMDTPTSAKVHNTRSKRMPSGNPRSSKKVELITSSQIKSKIKSNLNETGENQTKTSTSKTGKEKKTTKTKFIDPSRNFAWPLNAFGVFCSEYYGQLAKDDEEISSVQFYKSAAERWTSMTYEQKKVFERKRKSLLAQRTQPRFADA